MIRKYLPLIALAAVAYFLFWIKNNQRGKIATKPFPTTSTDQKKNPGPAPFNRNLEAIRYSKHARCRMECRHIDEEEVRQVLHEGTINYDKIEEDKKGKTYPLEGITRDGQEVRIVVAPHDDELVIVTVIDLKKEWQCNCY